MLATPQKWKREERLPRYYLKDLTFCHDTTFEALEVKNQMSHLLPFPKANFRKRSYLLTLRFSYIKLFLCYKNFFPDQLCFTKLTFLLLTFFTNIDLCSLIGRLLLFLILSLAHITMAVLGSINRQNVNWLKQTCSIGLITGKYLCHTLLTIHYIILHYIDSINKPYYG